MGKHKYIETPEKMWELFLAYKAKIKSNPKLVQDYVGKDAIEVLRKRERPLIMEGFENYVCDHTRISYPDLTEYFEGKNESYKDYFPVCSRIKNEIRADHIDGGMVEIYNTSITQRLNSLAEKTQEMSPQQIVIQANDEGMKDIIEKVKSDA